MTKPNLKILVKIFAITESAIWRVSEIPIVNANQITPDPDAK